MIGSPGINKHIRRVISPVLRNNGFSKVKTRNNWGYQEKCIWIFNIRAVGSYFSRVTGFPPMSLTAWLGVFYLFIPSRAQIKIDKDGLLLPPEYCDHMHYTLRNHNYDLQIRSGLENPAEVNRDDVWWVEPDGSNVEMMVNDLAESLKTVGLPWLVDMTDLEKAFLVTKKDRDCYVKFRLAMYLAKEIGKEAEFRRYKNCFEEEAKRINLPME
jgi:hypothetical protein